MHQLEGLRVSPFEHHTSFAGMLYLLKERAELDAAFVIDVSLWKESAFVTCLEKAGAQVDVLSVTQFVKASDTLKYVFPNAHVKTAWVKLIHLLFATADAACGKEGSHGIVDGFLDRSEGGMGAIGAAKGFRGRCFQLIIDVLKIVFRHDDVGV